MKRRTVGRLVAALGVVATVLSAAAMAGSAPLGLSSGFSDDSSLASRYWTAATDDSADSSIYVDVNASGSLLRIQAHHPFRMFLVEPGGTEQEILSPSGFTPWFSLWHILADTDEIVISFGGDAWVWSAGNFDTRGFTTEADGLWWFTSISPSGDEVAFFTQPCGDDNNCLADGTGGVVDRLGNRRFLEAGVGEVSIPYLISETGWTAGLSWNIEDNDGRPARWSPDGKMEILDLDMISAAPFGVSDNGVVTVTTSSAPQEALVWRTHDVVHIAPGEAIESMAWDISPAGEALLLWRDTAGEFHNSIWSSTSSTELTPRTHNAPCGAWAVIAASPGGEHLAGFTAPTEENEFIGQGVILSARSPTLDLAPIPASIDLTSTPEPCRSTSVAIDDLQVSLPEPLGAPLADLLDQIAPYR